MSETASEKLVVSDDDADRPAFGYEKPAPEADDDELGILLGFRLELPLSDTLDAAELTWSIPPSSPLLPVNWIGARRDAGAGASAPGPRRQLCLLTLIEPTPAESEVLCGVRPARPAGAAEIGGQAA